MRGYFLMCGAVLLAACGDNGSGPGGNDGRLSLAVGAVHTLTAAEAASLALAPPSASAEYVLIPFNSATAGTAQLELAATGVGAVIGPPSPSIGSADVRGPNTALGLRAAPLVDEARHLASLRKQGRDLTPLMTGARAALRARTDARLRANRVAAVPNVGDVLSLIVGNDLGCATVVPARTNVRVAAVTNRAIIVADVTNGAGGFTDDEYREFGVTFDTLLYPVDSTNFGAPTDIDQNGGRSIIVFTHVVNEATPKTSTTGSTYAYVAFRDLLPVAPIPAQQYPGCKTSNEGEIFYVIVPDPDGQYSVKHTKVDLQRVVPGVLGHELQHQINFGRRFYINDANVNEEVWLNEGLSHMAQELLFYRAAGLAPRQKLTLLKLRASQRYLDGINTYHTSNLGNVIDYLAEPQSNSAYASNDKLETRGATWQFLRYAADRKGGEEKAFWFALVNSKNGGLQNLNAVLSADALGYMRDGAIAQYTDDVLSGLDAKYTNPSWNYRDLLPAINQGNAALKTQPLTATAPLTLALVAGGTAYVRFSVASGAQATLKATSQGQAVATTMNLSLIRTR